MNIKQEIQISSTEPTAWILIQFVMDEYCAIIIGVDYTLLCVAREILQ